MKRWLKKRLKEEGIREIGDEYVVDTNRMLI